MGRGRRTFTICLTLLLCCIAGRKSAGMIFYSTGDPEYNTTAPQGELASSGWHLQGMWGLFLGTPISSNLFITAKHVRGSTNQTFLFEGASYTPIAAFDHPFADLTIWRVAGVFTNYAELYRGTNEVGKRLAVFGRGRNRGPELRLNGDLRGWYWGIFDRRLRWGENEVAEITDNEGEPVTSSNQVECLRALFNTNAGPNEAHLAGADSGGAVFIQEDGVWKLAGINFAVDGGFNTNAVGPGFDAALFDQRGLYRGSERLWVYQFGLTIQPSGFYATRISKYLPWIERIIQYGNPYGEVTLERATGVTNEFVAVMEAEFDLQQRTVRAPTTGQAAFYRLRALDALRITAITNLQDTIVITFK